MTVLKRLLKKTGLKDITLTGYSPRKDHYMLNVVHFDTNVQSHMHSSASYSFHIPQKLLDMAWNVSCRLTVEQALANGYVVSLTEMDEHFQNSMLESMLSEKTPNDTIYIDKYVDDGRLANWQRITVIPPVSCMDELKIQLDLEEDVAECASKCK